MVEKKKKLKVLAASDIEGSTEDAERLSKLAKKEKVDLVILAGDIHGMRESRRIITPFKENHLPLIFIPGNWDSTEDAKKLEKRYETKNIDGKYVNYHGVDIVGVGSPDWQLYLDEKEAFKNLAKNFEKIKTKNNKKILVSHLHAFGSSAELSGIRGSLAVRLAIEEFRPDVFLAGHIHEAEGIEEKIGKTKVFQVGNKGKIFEV